MQIFRESMCKLLGLRVVHLVLFKIRYENDDSNDVFLEIKVEASLGDYDSSNFKWNWLLSSTTSRRNTYQMPSGSFEDFVLDQWFGRYLCW